MKSGLVFFGFVILFLSCTCVGRDFGRVSFFCLDRLFQLLQNFFVCFEKAGDHGKLIRSCKIIMCAIDLLSIYELFLGDVIIVVFFML